MSQIFPIAYQHKFWGLEYHLNEKRTMRGGDGSLITYKCSAKVNECHDAPLEKSMNAFLSFRQAFAQCSKYNPKLDAELKKHHENLQDCMIERNVRRRRQQEQDGQTKALDEYIESCK